MVLYFVFYFLWGNNICTCFSMAVQLVKFILKPVNGCPFGFNSIARGISTAQYVASRARDPTFEKFMDYYKNLVKVVAIQDSKTSSLRILVETLHLYLSISCLDFP